MSTHMFIVVRSPFILCCDIYLIGTIDRFLAHVKISNDKHLARKTAGKQISDMQKPQVKHLRL